MIKVIFSFIGGLGMFLYGMQLMADGLQKTAGEKTKRLMNILTSRKILGVLVGALITAIIQSSSATTVMVVGFVNAGLLDLSQAVGVIMGANIGTTMTAWLVSMGEWGSFLKPETFAPLLVGIGAAILLFRPSERKKELGSIMIGFGILFVGLSTMSQAIKPYSASPIFSNAFAAIGSNPIFGILVGMIVTAIIQSSSASLGILQTLAMQGVVTWNSAVFIAMGQNIGTCVTALLSGAGAKKNAKRAAVIHFLFNVIGAVIFAVVLSIYFMLNQDAGKMSITSTQLAIFHTCFNVANTIILYPFSGLLVRLASLFVKEGENQKPQVTRLDSRVLNAPAFALETAAKEMNAMGDLALENLSYAKAAMIDLNKSHYNKIEETEKKINMYMTEITHFLVQLNMGVLSENQQLEVKNMMYMASDLERVSDHCENLGELCLEMNDGSHQFSIGAKDDLLQIFQATCQSLQTALRSRKEMDRQSALETSKYEDQVDFLVKTFREKHIRRLSKGECKVESGILFLDALSNLERISDHALNISQYVLEEIKN